MDINQSRINQLFIFKKSMTISTALFDFDGTLVDSDPIHLGIWNQLLDPYGVSIDAKFYAMNCTGEGSVRIAEKIKNRFPDVDFSPEDFAQDKDVTYEHWIATQTIPCMPGAREILEFLKWKGCTIGLVTSAPLSGVEKTLISNDMLRYFNLVVTREDVSRGKPAPDGYLYALNQLKVSGDTAAAFEDTGKGIKASKAAGIYSIAVRNTFTSLHDFHEADAICDNLFEAKKIIQRLTGG
jgi:HAD superfamily hydrolase (TIGR01509 family)